MKRREFSGIPVAPGVSMGQAKVRRSDHVCHAAESSGDDLTGLPEASHEDQGALWRQAHKRVLGFLGDLQAKTQAELGSESAAIFDAQQMILEDPMLEAEVMRGIGQGLSARDSVVRAADSLIARFESLDNTYMRARALDIRDLKSRLVLAIDGRGEGRRVRGEGSCADLAVLVTDDLAPSDVANLDRDALLGVVMEHGSPTSHASILAKALNKPVVIGVQGILDALHSGSVVVVDGNTGRVIVNPDADELGYYEAISGSSDADAALGCKALEGLIRSDASAERRGLFVRTADGARKVEIALNVGGLDDLKAARGLGLAGINVGMCRTEFMFFSTTIMPTEEEQTAAYVGIIRSVQPGEVTFRVLDVGGDKSVPAMRLPPEPNPFLGVRGIRLLLRKPEVLKAQLRAILRAAAIAGSAIRVMFPMVTVVDEWNQAMEAARLVQDELGREDDSVDWRSISKWGMMVEVPAVALTIDAFAATSDFFSIGTNDLTQYTMAADRSSSEVAYLHDPMNPGVIELIRRVVRGCHAHGKPVAVCGEMAAIPEAVPLLLKAEVDELSMVPSSVAQMVQIVSNTQLIT